MKQLAQSTFVFLALFILLVLSWFNTCQVDNLEQHVLQVQGVIAAWEAAGRP